jgi:ABC-type amino acid transport substrate-binding protein
MRRLFGLHIAMLAMLGWIQPGHAADDLLQKIKQRGTLLVCEAPYPPYNVKNPKTNQWEGVNVDLVNEMAKGLGVKVEHVDNSFATLIPSLSTGKCDISAAATYVTPGRAEQVLFTNSYSADTKTAFVPKDSPAHTYADLDKPGIVITSRSGTAEATFAQHFFKHATVKLTTSDATQAHLLEVAAKRADAAFAGYGGGIIFIQQNPNLNLRPLGDKQLDPSPFAFMLPLGEYHFQQYLDIAFDAMQRSGKVKDITDHYLSAPK